MKREFELWLDESGDFDNDIKKKKRGLNPSLIGGILVENNTFGRAAIERIILEDFSNGTEEGEKAAFEKFTKIEKEVQKIHGFTRYVVFSNEECIMVLDNNLTYQNIMNYAAAKQN